VNPTAQASPASSKGLNIGLWVAQVLVAGVFCYAGFAKLTTPIPVLSKMMAWTGQYPEMFVRIIGVIDLAGGLGILLPSLTRIMPRLTVIAAMAATVLQLLAIAFHFSRGEGALTPLNFILLALILFILWGRSKKAPIAPRPTA
jgi:uncharacterized membrane protein YphA (DoxX/SURF4 family)